MAGYPYYGSDEMYDPMEASEAGYLDRKNPRMGNARAVTDILQMMYHNKR